jgi:hypothetical protein
MPSQRVHLCADCYLATNYKLSSYCCLPVSRGVYRAVVWQWSCITGTCLSYRVFIAPFPSYALIKSFIIYKYFPQHPVFKRPLFLIILETRFQTYTKNTSEYLNLHKIKWKVTRNIWFPNVMNDCGQENCVHNANSNDNLEECEGKISPTILMDCNCFAWKKCAEKQQAS